jgi:hypothetical protein
MLSLSATMRECFCCAYWARRLRPRLRAPCVRYRYTTFSILSRPDNNIFSDDSFSPVDVRAVCACCCYACPLDWHATVRSFCVVRTAAQSNRYVDSPHGYVQALFDGTLLVQLCEQRSSPWYGSLGRRACGAEAAYSRLVVGGEGRSAWMLGAAPRARLLLPAYVRSPKSLLTRCVRRRHAMHGQRWVPSTVMRFRQQRRRGIRLNHTVRATASWVTCVCGPCPFILT